MSARSVTSSRVPDPVLPGSTARSSAGIGIPSAGPPNLGKAGTTRRPSGSTAGRWTTTETTGKTGNRPVTLPATSLSILTSDKAGVEKKRVHQDSTPDSAVRGMTGLPQQTAARPPGRGLHSGRRPGPVARCDAAGAAAYISEYDDSPALARAVDEVGRHGSIVGDSLHQALRRSGRSVRRHPALGHLEEALALLETGM